MELDNNNINADPAFEYWKEITTLKYIQKFENDIYFSGLTKNELFYGGRFTKKDSKYYDKAEKQISYKVKGIIYDERVNSMLRIEYSFSKLEQAEKYYELLVKKFTLSRVKICKYTWQEIRCYS